ncbi:MAG: DUF998 domain-containing protein [Nocardioidaceae bacterium]
MASSRRVVVGAVLLMASVQYFAAELIAASAWHDPPYNWRDDYISDLGAVECGPHICSPYHAVIGTSLVLHACVVLLATGLLSGMISSRGARSTVGALVVVHAAGNLIVAYSPLRPISDLNRLHYFGAALAICGGIAAIGLVGVVCLRGPGRRVFGVLSVAVGTVSLVALLLVRWNATRDEGLPDGLLERMAVDPIVVWCVVTGAVLLVTTYRRASVCGPDASGYRENRKPTEGRQP